MRTHIEKAVNRVNKLTSRLFRRPFSAPESISPTQSTPSPEVPTQPHDSEDTAPAVDYRSIASGYFAEKLTRRAPTEPAIELLSRDALLKGVKGRDLRSIIESEGDIADIARRLAGLLPDQLQRNARRTLALWQEREIRQAENASTIPQKSADTNDQKPTETKPPLPDESSSEQANSNETPPIRNYGIGRIIQTAAAVGNSYGDRIEILSEERIAMLIKERANKLAEGDQTMLAACTSIIDFLRERPTSYGNLGVKRLTDHRTFIEGKVLPIYSFNPGKTPELNLSRRRASTLRAAYMIYTKGDLKVVILDGDGIYSHEQYDKRYVKGKGKSS